MKLKNLDAKMQLSRVEDSSRSDNHKGRSMKTILSLFLAVATVAAAQPKPSSPPAKPVKKLKLNKRSEPYLESGYVCALASTALAANQNDHAASGVYAQYDCARIEAFIKTPVERLTVPGGQ